jgi:peptide chain release factor 2
MDETQKKLDSLRTTVSKAVAQVDLASMQKEADALQKKSEDPKFWSAAQEAQEVMKQQSRLLARITPWEKLQKELSDITELLELNDKSLQPDLAKQLTKAEDDFTRLKNQLKLAGEYDDHDAFLSIHAGAGGTDAQDWAQMLLRMYLRWAEKNDYKTTVIEESVGEEAGLKSTTIKINGDFAYGKLKGEDGVHRLVRLSPFNSDNLRQTSFTKVEVLPAIESPEEVVIDEKDLKIDVYRSGGHGGQSVNTTDSAVRITHIPTNITVAIQNERSQLQNKETALTIIRSRLAQLQLEQHKDKLSELRGLNEQAAWGNQIRSYVLHPYKQVKDLRTNHESKDPDKVLDGDLNDFIEAYLEHNLEA